MRTRNARSLAFRSTQAALCATAALGIVAATHVGEWRQEWRDWRTKSAQQNDLIRIDKNPLDFAGFHEDTSRRIMAPIRVDPLARRGQPTFGHQAALGWNEQTLLRNKFELDAVFTACDHKPSTCPPVTTAFRRMIQTARTIKDPLTQAGVVNAWVNATLAYNTDEVKTGHRNTLLQALETKQSVCDENAQLKYYALNKAGIAPENIRIVLAAITVGGKRVDNHAFLVLRTGENNWVLTNQQARVAQVPHPIAAAEQKKIFDFNASMPTDLAFANIGQHGVNQFGKSEIIPNQSITYSVATPYAGVTDRVIAPFYGATAHKVKAVRSHASQDFSLTQALNNLPPVTRNNAYDVLRDTLPPRRPVESTVASVPNTPARNPSV